MSSMDALSTVHNHSKKCREVGWIMALLLIHDREYAV